jgi:hypothetical protein
VRAVAVMVAAWWMSMAWAVAPAAAAERGGHGSAAMHGTRDGAAIQGRAVHGGQGARAHAHKGGKGVKANGAAAQRGATKVHAQVHPQAHPKPHARTTANAPHTVKSAQTVAHSPTHVQHHGTSVAHGATRTSHHASAHMRAPGAAAPKLAARQTAAPKHATVRPVAVRPTPHHKLVVQAPAAQPQHATRQSHEVPPILG